MATGSFPPARSCRPAPDHVIAIVGGGITGLALGLELARRDCEFVVLEAAERPGGVVQSREVDGRVLDWGPQRTRLTGPVRALVDELGLWPEVVTAPPDLDLYVYRAGRLRVVPVSVGAFLRSDVVGWSAKLRAMLEPLTAPPDPSERVDALFRRKLGRELYETVVGPLYGGLYASDPADMEVGLSLQGTLQDLGVGRSLLMPLLRRGKRPDPPAACTFRRGMEELPRALARRLGGRLRLSARVRRIASTGSGWRLDTDDDAVEAEHVVMTAPASVCGRLLRQVDPGVSHALEQLTYNPLAVAHLDASTELRGFGFQVSFSESGLPLRGVTFNDSLFGRRNLYTAYLGGARHPEVAAMSHDELAEVAVAQFRLVTGYDARVLSIEHRRMPAWDMSWRAVRGLQAPAGIHFAANWWSRPGLPGRLAEASRLAASLAPS